MLGRWALLLEDFNYKVEHGSGRNMTHVDALSRNSLTTTMLVADSEESIMVRQKKPKRRTRTYWNFGVKLNML